MLKRYLFALISLLYLNISIADDHAIKLKLEALMPGVKIESIQLLDSINLYEVIVESEVLYFSKDVRYVFQGDVISLETRQNLTEAKRLKITKGLLASLDEAEMITYQPKKIDYTVTVFTDIDCGYCRKLHQQIDEYNALGIQIRYLAYPRAGIDSEAFNKAEAVWCADDQKQAMTDAKNGQAVDSKSCSTPVAKQYELGKRMGVRGTPALLLESGEMLPGYIPPERLKALLDKQAMAGV